MFQMLHVRFWYLTAQVSGDVRVIFYQKMIGSRFFYACFNTAFIRNSMLQVTSMVSTCKEINSQVACVKNLIMVLSLLSKSCSSPYGTWIKLAAEVDQYVGLHFAWSCCLVLLIQSVHWCIHTMTTTTTTTNISAMISHHEIGFIEMLKGSYTQLSLTHTSGNFFHQKWMNLRSV